MDIERLKARAEEGDILSTLVLIGLLVEAERYDEALVWADRAAETGSPDGMYRAALLHAAYMAPAQEQCEWALLDAHAAAVRRYCSMLLHMQGGPEFLAEEETQEELRRHFLNARYYGAMACYYLPDADKQAGLRLLEGLNGTRERLLLHLIMMDIDDPREDGEDALACVEDKPYITAPKSRSEEGVYCMMIVLMTKVLKQMGDLNRAVTLMQERLPHVADQHMAGIVREELSHYRKRLFGGWKYVK